MNVRTLLSAVQGGRVLNHFNTQSDTWSHANDCAFCVAARQLERLMHATPMFDPGNKVTIGDVTGIVENVDVIYDVRITDINGNRRYGRFASEFVGPPPVPVDEFFSDRDGDAWQQSAGLLTLIEHRGMEPKVRVRYAKSYVEEQWGPLAPVKR